MTFTEFRVTVAARVPVETGVHTVVEVGPLQGTFGISLADRLNQSSLLSVSFLPVNQDASVLATLRTPAFEILLWRGDRLLFQGPGVVRQAQMSGSGTVFALQCKDVLHYLDRMMTDIDTDVVFNDVDQTAIATALIDTAQARPWSNYGVDTTGVDPTGVLRDRTYAAGTVNYVGQRVSELSAVSNGFDYWVDPASRQLLTAYPRRGVDRTATVVVDVSTIVTPAATWLFGAEDYVSDAFAVSPVEVGVLSGSARNLDVLTAYGRSDMAAVYQGVTTQATIDDHARRLADERMSPMFVPAPQVLVRDPDGFGANVGDTIETSYDYGLGLETVTARIATLVTTVGDDGNETVGLALVAS